MRRLHLRCGTDIRDGLRTAGVDGEFLEWADPVCQGPVRALPEPAYLEERRAWLSAAWDIPRAELDAKLVGTSTLAPTLEQYDEVCLWFEHDLFDQSMLVQVLASLAEAPGLHDRLRLISIDRHPDLARFVGFGQLRPEQLPPLFEARTPIQPAAFELARAVWDALRAPNPTSLREGNFDGPALPFLSGAVARHLAEFPQANGLGLTQRLTLETIAEFEQAQGTAFAIQVFGQLLRAKDPQPWYADTMWWAYLRELAAAPGALITMIGEFPAQQLNLTELGLAVLRGDASWLDHGGPGPHDPSRWHGGVELGS